MRLLAICLAVLNSSSRQGLPWSCQKLQYPLHYTTIPYSLSISFLLRVSYHLTQWSENYGLRAKFSPSLDSLKFYWNTGRPIHVYAVYRCLHTSMAEPSSCNRYHPAHKAWNISNLAFYRKSLLTCALIHCLTHYVFCIKYIPYEIEDFNQFCSLLYSQCQ